MQQYADIYLLQSRSTCFRCHPSSAVLKTVTAASGTGHNTGTATSLQRGLIGPIRPDQATLEIALTVWYQPVMAPENQTIPPIRCAGEFAAHSRRLDSHRC